LRFAICDLKTREAVLFDDAMIAAILPASASSGFTLAALSKSVSIINSSQKGTFVRFFFNHAKLCNEFGFERARQAGR
jgi:hypothetical protein